MRPVMSVLERTLPLAVFVGADVECELPVRARPDPHTTSDGVRVEGRGSGAAQNGTSLAGTVTGWGSVFPAPVFTATSNSLAGAFPGLASPTPE